MVYSKYIQNGTLQRVCKVAFGVVHAHVYVAFHLQVTSFKMWGRGMWLCR